MAGMGPAPSPNRRRANADTFAADKTTVQADGRTRGPALGRGYRTETRAWYATWRKSAQARAFTPTDWQRLMMLAPLVDSYWREPDVKLLTEIRQNESLLGATPLDRLRARISVVQAPERAPKPGKSQPAGVTAISDRRRRLIEG